METINICYASDEEYLPICGVSLYSLLKNSSYNYFNIYILYHKYNISVNSIEKFCDFFTKTFQYMQLKIIFIDISLYLENNHMNFQKPIKRISEATYYRLFLDEYIKEDKLLYLDCDTIVLEDVLNLWQVDISNYLFSACCDRGSILFREYISNALKTNPDTYFNAGVILFNLKEYHKRKIKNKCVQLLNSKTNFHYADQDILNICGDEQTLLLNNYWNKQWNDLAFPEKYNDKQDWSEVGIIHYTTAKKPWNNLNIENSNLFWYYALQTPYGSLLAIKYFESQKE